jgi:hypothetical protein
VYTCVFRPILSNMKLLLLKLTYFGFSSNSLFVLALYFPCNMRKIKNRNHKIIRQHVKYMLMYTKTHGKHGCGGRKSIYIGLSFSWSHICGQFCFSFFDFVINSCIVGCCSRFVIAEFISPRDSRGITTKDFKLSFTFIFLKKKKNIYL